MKRRAKPVYFQGVTSATILGHSVKVEGPQVLGEGHGHGHAAADEQCCIEIDGNVIYYELGEHGVHSHSYMHVNFATPWELAEALIRDYGALAVRGGPSGEAPPQDHPHHSPTHGHGTPRKKGRRK